MHVEHCRVAVSSGLDMGTVILNESRCDHLAGEPDAHHGRMQRLLRLPAPSFPKARQEMDS